MNVGAPPKYVNRDLNSQFGIKAKVHILSEVRAPPTSIATMGAAHMSKDERDAYDKYA
jgi:hypothetical protein